MSSVEQLSNELGQLRVANDEKQVPVKEPLFKTASKDNAILLIDASSSTKSEFENGIQIFMKFLEISSNLGYKNYRIIFWNSIGSNEKYPQGAYPMQFEIKEPKNLEIAFRLGADSIQGACLTCPHLAFHAIPNQWLACRPDIYLITDGEMGWGGITADEKLVLENDLADEFKRVSNANLKLYIVTVENKKRNFDVVEAKVAGNDVYEVLSKNNLTGLVTQFISYTPNRDPFLQINKNKPPAGYIPYGDKYFNELRTSEFMAYIYQEIKDHPSMDDQLKIAQMLTSTLDYLTRDKSRPGERGYCSFDVAANIIRTFTDMFTTLDRDIARAIITEAIKKERSGTAALYSGYRRQLNSIFEQADQMIKENVKEAIGVRDEFISYPINGRFLVGSVRLINASTKIHGVRYPTSSYNGVPVFPLDGILSTLQEQCLRQWTRAVFAAMYNTNIKSDEIIYLVMGVTMLVVNSKSVDDAAKNAFRRLSTIMLKKKRLNTVNETELERLEAGKPPIPNSGDINEFFTIMRSCCAKLKITASPMKLWYEMCAAMGGNLFKAQADHCTSNPGYSDEFKFEEYHSDEIPFEAALDYTCMISYDDLEKVGGHRIKGHVNAAGNLCEPMFLISDESLKTFLERGDRCICPICYSKLDMNNFEKVGPIIKFELPKLYETKIFEDSIPVQDNYQRGRNNGRNNANQNQNQRYVPVPRDQNGVDQKSYPGMLIELKGVVGAGKSTWAARAKEYYEKKGRRCIVEGTDKYCKDGKTNSQASAIIKDNLTDFVRNSTNSDVVIIDTCGDFRKNNGAVSFFGVDFRAWKIVQVWPNLNKKNIPGYLAWSLRNVLNRHAPGKNDNWYLNPVSASRQVCMDVHKKKSVNLGFGQHWKFSGIPEKDLESMAIEYEKNLIEPSFDL